jgi:putative DNA primase/helicase
MRQDFFTYIPTFKLTFIGNHRPALRNVDDAARRRFNIVPFVHKPPNPDKHLEQKLRAEWPQILRWMIDGCLAWQRNALARPEIVINATEEYFAEQDVIRSWVEDCCETGHRAFTDTSANLFQSWSGYALASGEKPGNRKWFCEALTRLGFHPARDMRSRRYEGIRLKVAAPHHETETDRDWP